MMGSLLSIPFYLFFSYGLIFGAFGLPNLGIAGAGWGIAIGDWLTVLALGAYLFFHSHYRMYFKNIFDKPLFSYLREIIRLGLPMGLMLCAELGFFFVMTLLMGKESLAALVANQLTMQYMGPLMGLMFCLAQAITVRMGHLLGAHQPQRAYKTGRIGIGLAVLFMTVVGLCYWLMPLVLIAVDFNIDVRSNEPILSLAKQFLWVAALFQIIEATRVTLFGALRGLKDTHYTFWVSLLSFWGIALPVGYGLNKMLNGHGVGYWWGMVIGASVSTLLLSRRFRWKISQ